MLSPIYTHINDCRDCYKCVRSCPVKAIQIQDGHAEIVQDLCTYCGTCVKECPNGVKVIRNDVDKVRSAFLSDRRVIASVAPSFAAEFEGREDNFLRALHRLGFDEISETAIGAALVSEAMDLYVENHGSAPFASTACPSVVELIKKYYPEYINDLAPFPSPLQAHCAYLRKLYGDDIVVVFIGPCAAKKLEAEQHPGYPDIALTFTEVEEWLNIESIDIENIDTGINVNLIPCKAGKSAIYPIENGQIQTSKLWENQFLNTKSVATSGINLILKSLKDSKDEMFIELLNCSGGCINGPGTSNHKPPLSKQKAIIKYALNRLEEDNVFAGDSEFSKQIYEQGYGIINASKPKAEPIPIRNDYSEEEIESAMLKLGKHGKEDELNCGGCGYPSCRDMAKALLSGLAEAEMCVTKMRKDAESKVDILLSTIPHGVVIVDNELSIADCNKEFVQTFGDFPEEFLDSEGLKKLRGMPLSAFVSFADKFQEQFYMTKHPQYRFKHKGQVMRITFFLVESKRLLGAMFEDITTPTVRREAVVNKTEEVISKSLETVQKIASLLGENAAETEIVLNSIIDEFNVQQDTSADYGLVEDTNTIKE